MKYIFIEKHQAEFSIKAMCRVLRVARSGWYTWCQRRTRISTRQQFRQHCDSVVLAAFTRSKQRYGAPRLTDELRAQGYPFNVKTVAASLRRQGLRAKASRKFSPVSYRAHGLPVSENLWGRIFTPVARTRRGQETSRTYVQMKAGCIWQWSLTCGHVPLLAGQCRHA